MARCISFGSVETALTAVCELIKSDRTRMRLSGWPWISRRMWRIGHLANWAASFSKRFGTLNGSFGTLSS